MKKRFVPAALAVMLLTAFGVFAQNTAKDYSGSWKLDVENSELRGRSRIQSMEMTVTQTASALTVERKAELAEGSGGGMGGRRGGGPGGGKLSYDLTGKETKAEAPGGFGGNVVLKAKVEKDGGLKLTQDRSFEGPMGAMTIKTVENWKLSEDGKTLTVSSNTETPRGTRSQKLVFTKQ